jgi:hypothetical protein
MYRILKADKDGYVTNKLIFSSITTLSRSTDANVGQAGTMDLFKLYNATSVASGTSGVELSRGVIHFDLSSLRDLTGSLLNVSDPSFKAYLSMKNVFGGQTVPSNFVLAVNPLGKAFTEGRGFDVIGYRDLDAVNWFTASIDGATITPWTSGGIAYAGDTADIDADYYLSGSSLLGYVPLTFSQSFARGDEDMFVDITPAVSAALTNNIPDHGFRVAYSGSQETDTVTRFVKRFSTRQSRNTNLHPALVIKYNDSFIDNQAETFLDFNNKVGLYYTPFGVQANFVSGSTTISGSGSIMLELVASKSVYVTATTYSLSHDATISYTSASWNYFSQSFTGSQISFGGLFQTGSYYADVFIPANTTGLSDVAQPDGSVAFVPVWKSVDNTVIFTTGASLTFKPLQGNVTAVQTKNYGINIPNLKDTYINTDSTKLQVYVYDYDTTLKSFYIPYSARPKILPTMYWRLVDPFTKETLVPFDDVGTKLSADGGGMYFTLYLQDLPVNKPLEIQFLIKENRETSLIENQGFTFKVVTA